MSASKPQVLVSLARRSYAAMYEAAVSINGRLGAPSSARRPTGVVAPASITKPQISEANVEYLRRMYTSTRGWYTAAETKAQLLLAVNGAFITVLFSVLFGRSDDVRAGTDHFGIDTWIFVSISIIGLTSAIVCAALSLWSLHGKTTTEFTRLGVDPKNPGSYRAEALWYFGHVARLQPDAVTDKLLLADRSFEVQALSYHVIDLAHKVLRKHRWVNAGWILTALALITLAAAGTSFFIHVQFG